MTMRFRVEEKAGKQAPIVRELVKVATVGLTASTPARELHVEGSR